MLSGPARALGIEMTVCLTGRLEAWSGPARALGIEMILQSLIQNMEGSQGLRGPWGLKFEKLVKMRQDGIVRACEGPGD